jgi:hypothetical protein
MPPKEVANRNLLSPIRASDMDTESTNTEVTHLRQQLLPRQVDLILLQKQLKGVVSENFEFRSTRNGIRVIMRSMADFQSVKSHFDSRNLSYYSFPKSEKPIKAVIRTTPLRKIFLTAW